MSSNIHHVCDNTRAFQCIKCHTHWIDIFGCLCQQIRSYRNSDISSCIPASSCVNRANDCPNPFVANKHLIPYFFHLRGKVLCIFIVDIVLDKIHVKQSNYLSIRCCLVFNNHLYFLVIQYQNQFQMSSTNFWFFITMILTSKLDVHPTVFFSMSVRYPRNLLTRFK